MVYGDINTLPRREKECLKHEGVDEWHRKFCVQVWPKKWGEMWVRKADYTNYSAGSYITVHPGFPENPEGLIYFGDFTLLAANNPLTIEPVIHKYPDGSIAYEFVGKASAELKRDGTFTFLTQSSSVPHIDKSEEVVKALNKAQKKAIKEVGKNNPQTLFFAIARISGFKGEIYSEQSVKKPESDSETART
jgi:hypothetical protein